MDLLYDKVIRDKVDISQFFEEFENSEDIQVQPWFYLMVWQGDLISSNFSTPDCKNKSARQPLSEG